MMRSMYSGVAGLKTHQTRMDVIGNNIANVNTVGYKAQAALFSELLYQNSSSATGPNAETQIGGINPKQVGLGVKMASISTNIALAGSAETTNNPFDMRITGNSFFVVSNGRERMFTRDGSFKVDAAGNLVMSSTGYMVQGWQVDPDNPGVIKPDTVSALQIMNAANMTSDAEATTKAYLSGILDDGSPEVQSKKDAADKETSGKIINLNFFDARGYSYTAKFRLVYDEDKSTGAVNQYKCILDKVLDNNITDDPTSPDNETDVTTKIKAQFAGKDAGDETFSISFDNTNGTVTEVTGKAKEPFTAKLTFDTGNYPNFSADGIEIDFSALKNLGNEKVSTAQATTGSADSTQGAGRKVGKMSGLSIQQDGKIYANYDNGISKLLGQIAVARFANASGLQKNGDNLYSPTQNSGDFDGIGVNITSDGGYMTTGELEMSNVDLSGELTGMIVTQRGFQANSRIITVSDTMLEELINLKR